MMISHVRMGACTHSPKHAHVSFLRMAEFPFASHLEWLMGPHAFIRNLAECMMVNVLERRAGTASSRAYRICQWCPTTDITWPLWGRSSFWSILHSLIDVFIHGDLSCLRITRPLMDEDGNGFWRADAYCVQPGCWAQGYSSDASPEAPVHPSEHSGHETRRLAPLETRLYVYIRVQMS